MLNVHESGINIFKLLWLKRRTILTKVLFENIYENKGGKHITRNWGRMGEKIICLFEMEEIFEFFTFAYRGEL